MTWLIVPIVAAFLVYIGLASRRSNVFAPENVFIYLQSIMATGSFPMLDPTEPADRVYGIVLLYTSLALMATVALLMYLPDRAGPAASGVGKPPSFVPTRLFWLLVGVSLAITATYLQAVGYSALLRGLANSFSGGDADIAGLRLESYSGSRYLFPGYVNQFKNALLPALAAVAITYWIRVRLPRVLFSALLIGVATFGLVATGQRGAFVLFVATIVVYVYTINGHRLPTSAVLFGGLLFLFVIAFTTIALGRASIAAHTTLTSQMLSAIEQFVERVLTANQSAGVVGFRHIYHLGPGYDGSEWLTSILGILPGYRGSDLATEIFSLRYGGRRGTSPPSIWGSIYYNFGPIGIALAPVVLAVVFRRMSVTIAAGTRNSLQAMGMAGATVVAGFWVSGGPVFLLNNGLVVYLALWWWGSRTQHVTGLQDFPLPGARLSWPSRRHSFGLR